MYAAYREQLKATMVPPKFVYFNVRGRAQPIRYLLEDNKIEYVEQTVSDFDDFFKNIKKTLKFGQLPCMHDEGVEIAQSGAIIRHLARKYNLYGDSLREAAEIDMLREAFVDMREALLKLIFIKDEQEYETAKTEYIKKLPDQFSKLQSILEANNGGKGFFVGSRVSMADYSLLDIFMNVSAFVPGCMDGHKLLTAFVERMQSRPNMAVFMASDKFKNCKITILDRLL